MSKCVHEPSPARRARSEAPVHNLRPSAYALPEGEGYLFFLMVAITGFLEIVLARQFFNGEMRPAYAISGHFVILAAIALHTLSIMKKGKDLRLSFLLFSFTLALGPAGAAATLLTAAMVSIFSRKTKPFEEWYCALFPDETSSQSDILEEIQAQRAQEERSIMPLIDVLTFGTHTQKQALLTMVTSNFKPAFAPVLKTALNDANNAIRVQAATGITKIEADFMTRAVDLTNRCEQNPDDADLLKEIAEHYDRYAYIGLLEHDRETECRNNALGYYARYLALRPEDSAARTAAGRILVRDRRYKDAVAWFERVGSDGTVVPRAPEEAVWYLESLFRLGHFAKVRAILMASGKELQDSAGLPLEILEAVQLWVDGNAEGNA